MGRIDRKKVVKRHNPILTAIDYESPLTVGNGFLPTPLTLPGCRAWEGIMPGTGIPCVPWRNGDGIPLPSEPINLPAASAR